MHEAPDRSAIRGFCTCRAVSPVARLPCSSAPGVGLTPKPALTHDRCALRTKSVPLDY